MKVIEKTYEPYVHNLKGEIVFLLDASGSMAMYQDPVINTFNEYINKVRLSDLKSRVTLYTFDSSGLVQVFRDQKVLTVKTLTREDYRPNAATPLYDAIGAVLSRHQGNFIQFIIHTDGQENDSHEYSPLNLNSIISSRSTAGCQFTWLGEGPEGWNSVKQFDGGQKFAYSNATRGSTMAAVGESSIRYASSGGVKLKDEDIFMGLHTDLK